MKKRFKNCFNDISSLTSNYNQIKENVEKLNQNMFISNQISTPSKIEKNQFNKNEILFESFEKRLDEYLKINNHVQLGLTIKQDIDYYPQIILFVNILCEKYENEKKDGKNFIKKKELVVCLTIFILRIIKLLKT